MQNEANRKSNMIRREDAAVAKSMGWPEVEDDEMQQTVLGDYNQITQPPQKPSGLGTLAKIGLTAALLGSGAAIPPAIAAVLNALKDNPDVVQPVVPGTVDTVGSLGFDD